MFLVSSLNLCSNLHLTIEANATLRFTNNHDNYPIITTRWEGREYAMYRACLYAKDIDTLLLDGSGTVDGNGFLWWENFQAGSKDIARPYLLSIEHSKNITIKDLHFCNSPAWTLHPYDCDNVLIDGVSVKNPYDSPNTDGCDPESCRNIRIVNCKFDVGDDCIAVKAGTEDALESIACEGMVIANCNMLHGHGGVVLGSKMSGTIKNVTISNCTFVNTDRGIRFKTRRGRGGSISNITISNIVMDNVLCPIVMNLYYFCGDKGKEKLVWDKAPYPVNDTTPKIKHVRIQNINALNIRSCAAIIYGLPEMPIEDVHISDSSFYLDKTSSPTTPAMFADAPKLAQKGFFMENTRNCELRDLLIVGTNDKPIFHNRSNKFLKVDL